MGLLVPGAGARRALAVSTVITAALAAAALAPAARTQPLSPGCTGANAGDLDGLHAQGGWVIPRTFAAGERLTVSAQPPISNAQPVSITLEINGTKVDSTAFPGTVNYTFTAAGGYTAWFFVTDSDGNRTANATWHVSCSHPVGSGSPPPQPPTRKRQCKHGGWKRYGSTFKNKRQCLRYVERHHHTKQ